MSSNSLNPFLDMGILSTLISIGFLVWQIWTSNRLLNFSKGELLEQDISLWLEGIFDHLGKNCQEMRIQVRKSFASATILTLVGMLVLVFSIFYLPGSDLGHQVKLIAGALTTFISETSFLLYTKSYGRLKEASAKMDDLMRLFVAFKFANTLEQPLRDSTISQIIIATMSSKRSR